ncbi:TldD/PmbA family protein, partial [Thermococci archaeon]
MIDKLIRILEKMNVDWEIYFSKSQVTSVKFRKIKEIEIERSTHKIVGGVGVRVIVDGYIGFSYLSGFSWSEEKLENLVKSAYKIAKLSKNYHPGFPVPKAYPTVKGLYDKDIERLALENLISWGHDLLDIPQSGEASIGSEVREREIVNSNGINVRDRSTEFAMHLYLYSKG